MFRRRLNSRLSDRDLHCLLRTPSQRRLGALHLPQRREHVTHKRSTHSQGLRKSLPLSSLGAPSYQQPGLHGTPAHVNKACSIPHSFPALSPTPSVFYPVSNSPKLVSYRTTARGPRRHGGVLQTPSQKLGFYPSPRRLNGADSRLRSGNGVWRPGLKTRGPVPDVRENRIFSWAIFVRQESLFRSSWLFPVVRLPSTRDLVPGFRPCGSSSHFVVSAWGICAGSAVHHLHRCIQLAKAPMVLDV